MRTAVGIISWQDGNAAIKRTVESAEHFADEIIIAEGPISAYPWSETNPTGILPMTTPDRTDFQSKIFFHSQQEWATQAAKRDFCLQYARLFKCDWLLFLDTDEYIVNPDTLWEWLLFIYKDNLAVPLLWENRENDDAVTVAPWKLINVNQCRAIVSRSYIIRTFSGETINLTDNQMIGQRVKPGHIGSDWPYIVHDPSIRPEWRKSFRLGPVEDTMEKMPEKASDFLCPPLPMYNGVTR